MKKLLVVGLLVAVMFSSMTYCDQKDTYLFPKFAVKELDNSEVADVCRSYKYSSEHECDAVMKSCEDLHVMLRDIRSYSVDILIETINNKIPESSKWDMQNKLFVAKYILSRDALFDSDIKGEIYYVLSAKGAYSKDKLDKETNLFSDYMIQEMENEIDRRIRVELGKDLGNAAD
jgi:hypothetical protein